MDTDILPKRTSTNWELCCLCQKETSEKLNEPHAKQHLHKAYETFEQDVQFYIDNDIVLPYLHPGSSIAKQNEFLSSLQSLINVVKDDTILNPYNENSSHLRTLDTGEYVDLEVAKSLNTIYGTGQELYNTFCNERIKKCTVPLSDIISKPKIFTFSHPPPANLEKSKKPSSNKTSTAIITQMFVSLQARPESNIDDFFRHENAKEPPSLSLKGKLRSGTKSQIVHCLPGLHLQSKQRTHQTSNGSDFLYACYCTYYKAK